MERKVLITGSFNILHPGHLRLFKFAKESGEKLYVGVLSDKNIQGRAYLNEKERLEAVQSISIVDKAFLISSSVSKIIRKIKPDIIVKGKEHESLNNVETKELKKYGGELIFSSGEASYSSYNIIKQELFDKNQSEIELVKKYLLKHKIHKKNLVERIKSFGKLSVCVLGDLIIDEYIHCETLGVSREEPVLVVSPSKRNVYVGGSGIVAAHVSSLGADVDYISVAGKDEYSKYAKSKLDEYGVKNTIFIDSSRQTTLKQRFLSEKNTVLKVSHLQQRSISIDLQKKIFNLIRKNINKYDLVIFSDFNYGCLPQDLVLKITNLERSHKLVMVADSQSSSQIGDISRFKNMDLLTPTESEIRLSLKNNQDGLVVIADKLLEISNAKNIILTLGQEGILIHSSKKQKKIFTDQLETLNSNPLDTSGAGDALLVGASLCIASGGSIWESAIVGSIMSSIQISRVGNIPIRQKDLLRKFN